MKDQTSYCSVAVINNVEYFQREGNIYQAPLDNVVMPDGYRCGRFLCRASRWNETEKLIIAKKRQIQEDVEDIKMRLGMTF